MNELLRTRMLLGENAFQKINQLSVLIIGIGGVGSHAAEALSRMGVGRLTLVDFDNLEITNSNRHVQSRMDRLGQNKAVAMKEHIAGTVPGCEVTALAMRFDPEHAEQILHSPFNFAIDAIDIMTNKLQLIQCLQQKNIPFISSMGMANRMDPRGVHLTTLYATKDDPFSKVVRKEARRAGIIDFPVVCSVEPSQKVLLEQDPSSTRNIPASCYFVPAMAGNLLAYWVINETVNG